MKKEEKTQLLEKSIEELRRMYEEICSAYSRAKTITLTFLGGSLAFLSYLYSEGDLFIPEEVYGIIFYFLGLSSYVVALVLLFLAIRSVMWETPTERKVHKKLDFKSYVDFLEYTKNLYLDALNTDLRHHEKKQKYLSLASIFLMIGAILLLVIKSFN